MFRFRDLPVRRRLLGAAAGSMVLVATASCVAAALRAPFAVISVGSALLVLLLVVLLERRVIRPALAEIDAPNQEAHSALRARGRLISGMSHEMRTPLHAILSAAALGSQRAASLTPEKAARYYGMIEDGGRRLLGLLDDVVDLVRLEDGKRVLALRSAPVEGVVVSVVEELRPHLQERGVRLDVGPCEAARGWIDREALMQVLRCVLMNAAERPGAGGVVAVALVRSDRGSVISVTGSGGPHEAPSRAAEVKLAICRRIMEAHGGRIWEEPRDGSGPTVRVEIPDRAPAISPPTPRSPQTADRSAA